VNAEVFNLDDALLLREMNLGPRAGWHQGMEFKAWHSGIRGQGLGFKVENLGFRGKGERFRVYGSRFGF
jgi:hypothetical protein